MEPIDPANPSTPAHPASGTAVVDGAPEQMSTGFSCRATAQAGGGPELPRTTRAGVE